jgi:hypothetical protein
MSDTLVVPPTLAKYVREGLHIEISTAAESITTMTERVGEWPVEVYREPVKLQCDALAVLDEIGGVTPDPPVEFKVNLAAHYPILLRTLLAQQRSYMERTDIMDDNGQRIALIRVEELDKLIKAAQRYKQSRVM